MTPSVQASIAAIERGLAERPVGSTFRALPPPMPAPAVEFDDDPEPFRKALPPPYPRPCAAECGAVVTYPGVCAKCGDAATRAEAALEFKAALDSIPDRFRWARVGSPDLDAFCGIVVDKHGVELLSHGRPMSMSRNVVPRIVNQLVNGNVRNYTLRGEPDAGKTSVACAAIRLLIERAITAWIAFTRTRRGSRLAPEAREPRIVTLARGARFVAARDLAPPRDRGQDAPPAMFATATRATILVLDDVGQEVPPDGDIGFNVAERIQATRDIVTGRWDPGLSIIATTFLSDKELFDLYAGGVQKRLVKSKQVSVIELQKRGGKNV